MRGLKKALFAAMLVGFTYGSCFPNCCDLKLPLGCFKAQPCELLLLLLGGGWLLWNKTANRAIVAATIGSFLALHGALWLTGVAGVGDPFRAMLSGGFILGALFMATDPVSATKTPAGRWLYGIMIGSLTVVIRVFSAWPEGIMFAILLANMFGPITDHLVSAWQPRGKTA